MFVQTLNKQQLFGIPTSKLGLINSLESVQKFALGIHNKLES